jgi:predicted ATPase
MKEGLAGYEATGAKIGCPWFMAGIAEACSNAGRTEEGLTILSAALTMALTTQDRCFEAELYRIKGELTLQLESKEQRARSTEQEAETCFLKAIDVAQRQEAKSLELRATVSLARLWQQQGKKADAHHMLSTIYNWFTEGFETRDLQEANALLESLESSV